MLTYPPQTEIRFSATFTQVSNGQVIDPTDVFLYMQRGSDAPLIFTYLNSEIVRDSTGVFHYDYTPAEGNWTIAWKGTGSVVAGSYDTQFRVFQSALI